MARTMDSVMPRLTLTFDNGPTPGVTEQVLATLAERGLRATFFVVGEKLKQPGGPWRSPRRRRRLATGSFS